MQEVVHGLDIISLGSDVSLCHWNLHQCTDAGVSEASLSSR